PYLTVSISGTFHKTYGGLTVYYLFNPEDFSINPGVTEEEFLEHDRILHDDQIRAGFGVSYTLTPAWSVYAGYATVVDGASSHYGDGITLGLQWNRSVPHLWQSASSEK
ncbi:MAG TPA: hypothetical protein VMO47_03125, partial [Rhodothermales bacterium]|nr:hypothetical protein [Rhodothermales bacterium]